jgi:hypothetical protein
MMTCTYPHGRFRIAAVWQPRSVVSLGTDSAESLSPLQAGLSGRLIPEGRVVHV